MAEAPGTVLEALGDGTRRQVFELLRAGPRSVGELADALPVSRPAVSQHLRALKEAGLVDDEADGRHRRYRIVPEGLGRLRRWLEELWTEAIDAFGAYVEEERS